MNSIPNNAPSVKTVSVPFLSKLSPPEIMEWLYSSISITLSPGWRGAREALIFDGRDAPIILYRGDTKRISYSEYISLVRSGVIDPNPEIPFPERFATYPEVRLRFRPSRRTATPGVVYVIGNGKGEYKIGRAKNATRRMAEFQIASTDLLTLHVVIPTRDSLNTERLLHHAFFAQRLSGEWFQLSSDDLLKAQEVCNE